jgi:hypothetical protein
VTRAARFLAVAASAVLGIAGGVVAGLASGDSHPDPLGLGVAMVNQPCQPNQGLLVLDTSDDGRGLASAIASFPDAKYLEVAKSCNTVWRDPTLSTRRYAAYLGPMDVGTACRQQMTGEHVGDRVTRLTPNNTELELCLCYVSSFDAPTVRPGATALSSTEIVYLRALQQVLTSLGRRPPDLPRTDDYDSTTLEEVLSFQRYTNRGQRGVVDQRTWEALINRGCQPKS